MRDMLLAFDKPLGDNVQFAARDELSISVEEPWAGSTESGFGYHCSITITRDEASKLRDFLSDWLSAKR